MIRQYLWYFLIYACLGWMAEVCFAAATTGKIVNRGFLNGPVCPIYGAGMSIVIWCLSPLLQKPLLLFLGSVALTTLLEGLTGFVMEKLFHQRWWDYSDAPFNIGGYVCLKFSLMWGFGCMLVLDVVHPPIRDLVAILPQTLSVVLLCILYAVLFADLLATLRTIARLNRQLGEIDDVAKKLRALSDDMTKDLSEGTLTAMEKSVDLQQKSAFIWQELRHRGFEWRSGALCRIDEVKDQLDEYRTELRTKYETVQGKAELARMERVARRQARMDELIDQQSKLLERSVFGVGRMLDAFENMRSTAHADALETLKKRRKS